MSNPLGLIVHKDWVNIPTDGTLCNECKTAIASKEMWQLIVFVNYEPIETKIKLCESCYEAINLEEEL